MLAASVLVMAASAAGGSFYFTRQRQERALKFNRALGEAEGLYAEAQRDGRRSCLGGSPPGKRPTSSRGF